MYKLILEHNMSSSGLKKLELNQQLFYDIESIECTSYLKMPMIKKALIEIFSNYGFRHRIKLHAEHNLYITGLKSRVGLCVQMGHKAGFYFDLCKLSFMKDQGLIDTAIVILPSKALEKFCNTSSVASHELISRQMSLFNNIYNIKMHLMRLDIHRRI